MSSNAQKTYSYTFWGKHIAFIYGVVALLIISPLPLWLELVFHQKPHNESASFVFAVTGVVVSVYCFWSDFHDRFMFSDIIINNKEICANNNKANICIPWGDIIKLEHLQYIDVERKLAWGLKGICVVGKNGEAILIFSTVRQYHELIKIINSRVGRTNRMDI